MQLSIVATRSAVARQRPLLALVSLLALSMSACSSEGGGTGRVDSGTGGADSGSPPGTDSGTPPSDTDSGPRVFPDAGPPPEGGGTLRGVVTRSAMPMAGGRGHLYIAVFDRDPVLNRDSAVLVANGLVTDADMSAGDARVPYMVLGIPPRTDPYFVVAFLDDNGTADTTDPSRAGPDRGDLVSLMGLSAPQVTVSSETVVMYDIELNANLPF